MAEIYKFHQRTQKDGEGVTAFAAELRRLASTCNFGAFLGEALRDQLVCSIRSSNTQRKLLSEVRSFDQAMQMALADEVAHAEAKQIAPKHSVDSTENTVGVVSDRKHSENKQSPTTATKYMRQNNKIRRKLCYRCNGGHPHQECRFKEVTCHFGQKKGHILAACRKKISETHLVNTTHNSAEYCLYNVNDRPTSHQPIKVGVHMDGNSVDMLVDTGSGVSIINEATYRGLWSLLPKLQAADINLTSYTGQSIPVLGQIEIVTEYKQQSAYVPIVIVSGDRQNLLGRNLLSQLKLDWSEIMLVRNLDPIHAELLAEVPDVFAEGLGKLKEMQVKINVKS